MSSAGNLRDVQTVSVTTRATIVRWRSERAAPGAVRIEGPLGWNATFEEQEVTNDHYVFVGGLTPGTTYRFRVRCGGEFSGEAAFATASKIEDLWPVVSVSFDDGHVSHFATAFPLMRERNMRGAVNVITDRLAVPVGMSLAQVKSLHAQGWEVDSHSRGHNRDKSLGDDDEIVGSLRFLQANGFARVPCYRIPGSNHTPAREDLAARCYPLRWGHVIGAPASPRFTTLPLRSGLYAGVSLDARQFPTREERVAKYKAAIETVLSQRQYTHFIFHAIADFDLPGYNYPPVEFAAFLDFLQEKGVAVVPPGELLAEPAAVVDRSDARGRNAHAAAGARSDFAFSS